MCEECQGSKNIQHDASVNVFKKPQIEVSSLNCENTDDKNDVYVHPVYAVRVIILLGNNERREIINWIQKQASPLELALKVSV